jgi:HK97 family phage major capsid protein
MEIKDLATQIDTFTGTVNARILGIEQKLTAPRSGGGFYDQLDTIGSLVTKSDGFQMMLAKGARSTGQIPVGNIHQKATTLTNATLNTAQPLVGPYRVPGIVMPGQQRLTIRDLLTAYPAPSNLVAFAKETGSTNAAAPQASEGAVKPQSDLTFTLASAPVSTLAHWLAASKQILEDSTALQTYINTRLLYFLKLLEENQLLNGDGTGTNLSGLILNATTYDLSFSNVSSDTFIDTLSHAITQVENNSNLPADGVVVNNLDWETIKLTKTSGTALNGQYIYSDPHAATAPTIWGLPVIPTKSMARGQFLVGNFAMGAAIWDRNDATVEISREHADFWVRNLVAILCEERLALTVFRGDAFVTGGFPFGS